MIRVLFLSAAILLGSNIEARWINMGGDPGTPPAISVIEDSESSTIIKVDIFGFYIQRISYNDSSYSLLRLPNVNNLQMAGYPSLPFICINIIVSDHGAIDFLVENEENSMMSIDPVIPSKGIIMRSELPDTVSVILSDLYERGGQFPLSTAELSPPFIFRDYRGIAINLYPFAHDPKTRELIIRKSFTVGIVNVGGNGENEKLVLRSGKTDPTFDCLYGHYFLNYPGSYQRNQLLRQTGKMLFVIANEHYNEYLLNPNSTLGDLISWKKRRGLDIILEPWGERPFTGQHLIQLVSDQYDLEPDLSYVILVGDGGDEDSNDGFRLPMPEGDRPPASTNAWPCDFMCSLVEGDDYLPDICLSRLSAANDSELSAQISRIINYERQPDDGSSGWYQKAMGCASWEGEVYCEIFDNYKADWKWADSLKTVLEDGGFSHVDDHLYYKDDPCPANPFSIQSVINEGRSLVNFLGHGFGDDWGFRAVSNNVYFSIFTNSDVQGFTNPCYYPFVVSVACWAGDISNPDFDCFAHVWQTTQDQNQQNIGSVGFFGSSGEQSWTPPLVAQFEASRLLVQEEEGVHSTGGLCYGGVSKMVTDFNYLYPVWEEHYDKMISTAESWILFGDCSMQLRTRPPEPIYVYHPTHVGCYQSSGTIWIPIWVEGLNPGDEVVMTLIWSESGQEEIEKTFYYENYVPQYFEIPVDQGNTIDVTISGFNKYPYESQIEVASEYYRYAGNEHRLMGKFQIRNSIHSNGDLQIKRHDGAVTFYVADNPLPGDGGLDELDEIEFIVENGDQVTIDGCRFRLDGEIGDWSGFYLEGAGSEFIALNDTISGAIWGIKPDTYSTLAVNNCHFEDNEYGIQFYSAYVDDAISNCSFVNNDIAIQVHDSDIDISNCDFYGYKSGLDKGIDYRDGSLGTVSGCQFLCDTESYHAIDCRSGNNSITAIDNLFQVNEGSFGCTSIFGLNHHAIFALGPVTNIPKIRQSIIDGHWYGVTAFGGSRVDLGTPIEDGTNEFFNNCCYIQYSSRIQGPPEYIHADGNCWDGSTNPDESLFCGIWSEYILEGEGVCPASDGVPSVIPLELALEVKGPNPFTDMTRLSLALPEIPQSKQVFVDFFNVTGHSVKSYSFDVQCAGTYDLYWNGRTDDGVCVSSGLYVCRVSVDETIFSKPLVFIREAATLDK